MSDNRLTEANVGLAVMRVLNASPDQTADVGTVVKHLPEHVQLSDADKAQSTTRPNEQMWEQQVRNLKSHDKTPGNAFAEGFIEQVGKGVWKLTERGRLHLEHKG